MSTLSDTQANYGLFADATPISLAGTSKRRIGRTQQRVSFASSDILYRIQMTATAAADAVTVNLRLGAVTQDNGTPDVARWTGNDSDLAAKDFEGVTLPEADTLFCVVVEMSSANDKYITLDSNLDWFPSIPEGQPGLILMASPAGAGGYVATPPNLEFTWEDDAGSIGGIVTVTVCAKS